MSSSVKAALQKKVVKRLKGLRKKKSGKKGPFRGKWVMWSNKDHRWDAEGTSEIGGDRRPDEMIKMVEKFKKKLGDPPDDLSWTYKLE
jgi:hypothetical protein